MGLIQRLRDRFGKQKRSVQYEVQVMTQKGGWKRHQPFHWDGRYGRPDHDDDYLITTPGRYREIRRVDGRIDEELWRYETPDAEAHYQREREREKVEELSVEKILDELQERDEITELDRSELMHEVRLRILEMQIEQNNS
ncbi:hypothetical protein [Halorubrum vacuolatum]|uniref:Uncharacterized protein n=1 Tax=Halorubrum vacuolatum TaxID=63740 RepID=A0A238YIL3_HALVU|nr:hypothetical protein [Halorubrum vacuolatum]SNR70967.1 hypothetical protein SAMN06264855_1492 [Halorubrum vacuolatum]